MKKLITFAVAAFLTVFSAAAGTWDLNGNYMIRKNTTIEMKNDLSLDLDKGKGFQGVFTKFFGDPGFVDFGFNITLGFDDIKLDDDTLSNKYIAFGPAAKVNLTGNIVLFGTVGFMAELTDVDKSGDSIVTSGFNANAGIRLYFNEFIGLNAGCDYGIINKGTYHHDRTDEDFDVTGGKILKFYAGVALRLGE